MYTPTLITYIHTPKLPSFTLSVCLCAFYFIFVLIMSLSWSLLHPACGNLCMPTFRTPMAILSYIMQLSMVTENLYPFSFALEHQQTYLITLVCPYSYQTTSLSMLQCLQQSTGSFPLHLASWKGDLEVVKLLVQQGPSRANVNQQNNSDDTSLHLASQYGYCGVVEFLLEVSAHFVILRLFSVHECSCAIKRFFFISQRHADPMMKNNNGETPLDLAAQFGHLDTVSAKPL